MAGNRRVDISHRWVDELRRCCAGHCRDLPQAACPQGRRREEYQLPFLLGPLFVLLTELHHPYPGKAKLVLTGVTAWLVKTCCAIRSIHAAHHHLAIAMPFWRSLSFVL